jgi:hypothetical protein
LTLLSQFFGQGDDASAYNLYLKGLIHTLHLNPQIRFSV